MVATLGLMLLQHAAVTPVSRMNEAWWSERHSAAVQATRSGNIDVAFVGDSITQGWEGAGKAVWDSQIAPLKAANFGFSGDRTEHVLWRLENGELITAQPKVVVIMIGTNNVYGSTPAMIGDGVTAIVSKLLSQMRAKILLLGIFPRGEAANDVGRIGAAEATKIFFASCDMPRVTRLDIGQYFVRSDGVLRTYLMPDRLHLSADGYAIWARAVVPTIKKLLAL